MPRPTLRQRLSAFLNPNLDDAVNRAVVDVLRSSGFDAARHLGDSTGKDKKGHSYAHRPLEGGRQTQPVNYNPFGLNSWYWLPKREYQLIDTSKLDVTMFSAEQLLALLPDLSPDFSKAVWNYLRHAGTDVKFVGLTLDGDESPQIQRELDDISAGLNEQWGGIAALVRQLELTTYLQGAAVLDVAPTMDLRDVQDFYVVNPDTVWFQRDENQILVPFQRQMIWGQNHPTPFRQMNEETFFYTPVDPYPDDPYGRPPAAPALTAALQLAVVLRDLSKVVHHQGWPKLDLSVAWELIENTMPEDVKLDPQAKAAYINARFGEIKSAYAAMAPEDAFVHLDYLRINPDGKAVDVKFPDFSAIVNVFRTQLIQALKSLSIFHGQQEGSTETYGTVEYEIYVASIKTMQEVVASCLARAFTVALNLRGIQGTVKHEWAPIRTTQRLADAQAEAQEIANEVDKRDQGWVTQDDSSNKITGSDAVGPAPDPMAAVMGPVAPFKQTPKTFPPGKGAPDVGKKTGNAKESAPSKATPKTTKDIVRSLEMMTGAKGITMALVRAAAQRAVDDAA